jgi:sugar/nucleoside kinase (ribokinase family)
MEKLEPTTKKNTPVVIGTGLIALDVVIHGNEYQLSQRWAGGTCGNVLIILSYFGWSAYPVSRLNGETASRRVLRDLKRWKLQLDFAKSVPRVNTPIVIHKILSNERVRGAHRFSLKCPNCGAWLPTYRPITSSSAQRVAKKIEDPKVFFFDRVSRGSIMLAKTSAEKGALVVFEPSGVGEPKLFQEAVDLAHIIKYSQERMDNASKIKAAKHGVLEIQTLGSKGLRYRSNLSSAPTRGWQHVNACKVTDVRDTAGAGDWCTAGIIHRLGRQGLSGFKTTSVTKLQDAIRFGQALAAWTCAFEGALGGMYQVDRIAFKAEVAKLMSQFKQPKLNSANQSSISDLTSVPKCDQLGKIVTGSNVVRLPALGQAQDACCF